MKKVSTLRILFGTLAMLLAVGALIAQDIPVRNWEIPSAELSKMTHFVEPPLPFSPVSPPCRLNDSRVSSGGPGPIPGSGSRAYDFVPGGSSDCGSLPGNVVALSLLFTVVNPLGSGFIYAYPTGSPPSSPISMINYNAGDLRNNAVIVPVNPATGSFSVTAGVSGTDLIIDINGVFYNNLEDADQFVIATTRGAGAAILGLNNATAAGSHGLGGFANGGVVHGVQGQVGTTSLGGASGVHGINDSSAGFAFGVLGEITPTGAGGSSAGVRGQNAGTAGLGIGVWGSHAGSGWGGLFTSVSGLGVNALSSNGTAVRANSNAATGLFYGVDADTASTTNCAAAVRGYIGNPLACVLSGRIGVFGNEGSGATFGWGVFGVSEARGVQGSRADAAGALQSSGVLGYTGNAGVHSFNDITALGTKFFIEPHPTDPDLEIAYVSLEGNEAGTYFRGKGKFQNGLARIAIPEDFRMVSEPDGLGIQVTPIGEMASVAVLRVNLNEIVVKGSRNVEFFYTVNGVRRGRAGFQAVRKNAFFKPASHNDTMPELSRETRVKLIQAGILTPDGTPNMETAERLGWKAEWEKNEAEAKARAEATAKAKAKEAAEQQQ